MKPDKTQRDDIRKPQQQRSRQRVDQILDAARQVIAERGSAGVTITEIAEVAGITPGSMYQYFPNKVAIIDALGARYLEAFSQRLETEIGIAPQTAEDMATAFDTLIEADYQAGRTDPAIRDIWLGMTANTTLAEIFAAETHRNVAMLTAAARPLVRVGERDQLENSMALMFHFADTAIRVALDLPEAEGRAVLERGKAMLRLIWLSMV